MKLDKAMAKVARATVRFLKQGGQGVIVPDGLIVTAAHVITWDGTGAMALGDKYVEEIEAGRQKILAQVYAAEPVSDIAVLGMLDEQGAPQAEAFETCLAAIAPVRICLANFPVGKPIKAFIRTHTGDWIAARATQWHVNASVLAIEADEAIEGGTSGGPVITGEGRLLGVISVAGSKRGEPARTGRIPRLHLTAPGWLIRRMRDPQWEVRASRQWIGIRPGEAAEP